MCIDQYITFPAKVAVYSSAAWQIEKKKKLHIHQQAALNRHFPEKWLYILKVQSISNTFPKQKNFKGQRKTFNSLDGRNISPEIYENRLILCISIE